MLPITMLPSDMNNIVRAVTYGKAHLVIEANIIRRICQNADDYNGRPRQLRHGEDSRRVALIESAKGLLQQQGLERHWVGCDVLFISSR